MSEPLAPRQGQPPQLGDAPPTTVASRLALWQRAGGVIVPVLTAVLAFLIGGLLVLATGHNPFQAYWDIVKGAGLNWLAHPTNTDVANTAPHAARKTIEAAAAARAMRRRFTAPPSAPARASPLPRASSAR